MYSRSSCPLPTPRPLQIQCPVALIDFNLDTQPPEASAAEAPSPGAAGSQPCAMRLRRPRTLLPPLPAQGHYLGLRRKLTLCRHPHSPLHPPPPCMILQGPHAQSPYFDLRFARPPPTLFTSSTRPPPSGSSWPAGSGAGWAGPPLSPPPSWRPASVWGPCWRGGVQASESRHGPGPAALNPGSRGCSSSSNTPWSCCPTPALQSPPARPPSLLSAPLPSLLCRSPVRELAKDSSLPPVKGLWTVEQRLGGWKEAQQRFFDDGVSPGEGGGRLGDTPAPMAEAVG